MNKRKSLSKFILLMLEKSVDGFVRLDDFAKNPHYYAYGDGWDYPLNKSALANALKRLREKGLIDFVDNEKLKIKLTEIGKDQALWNKMKNTEERWDKKWRMVIWDIPEKRRSA